MKKSRVCILSFSNIAWDGRVLREIEAASRVYEVDVIGYGKWDPPEGVRFLPVTKTKDRATAFPPNIFWILLGRLKRSAWDHNYWLKQEYQQAVGLLESQSYDLIHANDWDALPVAITAARVNKSRVLFDAHEYSLEQGVDNPRAKLRVPYLEHFLKSFGEEPVRKITVGEGIAALYRSHFDWECEVIMNAPYYVQSEFRPADPAHIDLVYHGAALRGRYLEDLISMTGVLDERFHLNLMLMASDAGYLRTLKNKSRHAAPSRIHFVEPVPPGDIVNRISAFDIGIPVLRAKNKNNFYALPNKFFEYIMAGLAISVPALPDMQRIVEKNHAGVVSPDQSWRSMAAALNALTVEQINAFKKNSLELAKSLNAEYELKKLMDIYAGILALQDGPQGDSIK